MPLTEIAIRNLKPSEKRYTVSDGRGLMLEVRPNGAKCWVLRLWSGGKERRRQLGRYPQMSLKEARTAAAMVKEAPEAEQCAETFGDIAGEWLKMRGAELAQSTLRTLKGRLNGLIIPAIGSVKINSLTPKVILQFLRELESDGKYATVAMCRGIIGRICRYAIASDLMDTDPTYALRGALRRHETKHMPTITEPEKIAVLMRSIRGLKDSLSKYALLFSAYTFARPKEIRYAEWNEINGADWFIPADKMKMRRPHLVPLSVQALAVLERVKPVSGGGRFVFRSAAADRPLSYSWLNILLSRLETDGKITHHGFRAMASTRLNEMGYRPDVIERQLAHAEPNATRRAYNHAEYIEERREMMQKWADYLDALK